MKPVIPPTKEGLEYIRQNMAVVDGLVVWTATKFKRIKGEMCGWVDGAGYQRINLPNRKFVRGHQVAYYLAHGEWPHSYVDHVDGNRLNNDPANLRLVNDCGNSRNARSGKNQTGYQGVSFASGSYKAAYKAEIMLNKKRLYLGCFDSAELAHAAYKAASLKLHGDHSPYAANGESA